MARYSLNLVKIILINMLLASLVVTGQAGGYIPPLKSASLQEEERVVEKLSPRFHAPLQIGAIKRKRGEVALGKKFSDREDWFQGLSLVMENTSGKTIVYIRGGFLFPRQIEMKGQAPPLYHSFRYGLPPFIPQEAGSNAQQLVLKPGETITFTLSDSDYNEITAHLRRLEYTHGIKVIKFNLEEIFFDDGTGWAAGKYLPRERNERQPLSGIPQNYSAPTRSNFGELSNFGDLGVFFWLPKTPPTGRKLHRPNRIAARHCGRVRHLRRILQQAMLHPTISFTDILLQKRSMDSRAHYWRRTRYHYY